MPNKETIRVYGADWCPMTIRVRHHLDQLGTSYEYIDVEGDCEASRWVKEQNGGAEKKPTLDVAGEILTEPDNDTLDLVLQRHGLLT